MKFVASSCIWDDNDYVVTIRPEDEQVWKALPLGPTLSKRDADKVAQWLQQALPDLWTIFVNTK